MRRITLLRLRRGSAKISGAEIGYERESLQLRWFRNCVTAKAFANIAGRVINLELEGARPVFGSNGGLYYTVGGLFSTGELQDLAISRAQWRVDSAFGGMSGARGS